MPRKRVTLYDLAEQLGLTIQTVSKALRGHSGMSEQTRTEVILLARKLGYRTREQKHSLKSEGIPAYPLAHRRFVLVQNEQSLNFNRLLLQGLRARLDEFGHTVHPLLIPPNLPPHAFEEWAEEQELHYAEGLFIAPRMGHDEFEQRLLDMPIPRILLNFPPHECKVDSVIWDVYEAVIQSVRHLKRLGHKRILYIGDLGGQRGFALRWQAYREAMEEDGLPLHSMQLRGGETGLARDLRTLFESLQPTAVLCGIDEEASRVYRALQVQLGLAIPRQCSFVALLNEPAAELHACSRPNLLIQETGYRAADRMLWRIANPTLPWEHIRLRGEYHSGRTTAEPVNGFAPLSRRLPTQ
ncbi:LacI family DNA-binding transcriptional regulator [Paenibacillus sp. GCM10023252]|uniref:LacI family DNA-binding transcriptional regulator n=1 Tax=Paenibacillus sp. GCM10023252 TaxID=3252649 RepID=UPI003620B4AC